MGRHLGASRGSGYLIYVNRGTLFAVPFDPMALEIGGPAVPILEQIALNSKFRTGRRSLHLSITEPHSELSSRPSGRPAKLGTEILRPILRSYRREPLTSRFRKTYSGIYPHGQAGRNASR